MCKPVWALHMHSRFQAISFAWELVDTRTLDHTIIKATIPYLRTNRPKT